MPRIIVVLLLTHGGCCDRHSLLPRSAALQCHPDRFSDKDDAERKAAEAQFKELGDALDILTDPFKRQLWDEGHDVDSIAQQVAMREQQQGRSQR